MTSHPIARALLSAFVIVAGVEAASAAEPAAVKFRLSWFAHPGHGPVLVAAEKGFYRDVGVDFSWEPGKGSFDAIQVVGSGAAQLGISDATTLVKGIANGIPVKAVMMLFQKTPAAVIASADVKSPKDLEGKKLASVATTATAKIFPAFAKLNNIDVSKIEIVESSFATQLPMFLSGKVDALHGYAFAEWIQARRAGKPATLIRWSDFGLNMYGNTIFVNSDYAKDNHETVKRVVQATIRGMRYALAHADETVDIVKKHSAAQKGLIAAQWQEVAKLLEGEDTAKSGLGWMTAEGWRSLQRLNLQYGGQKAELPLDRLFTTQYLK